MKTKIKKTSKFIREYGMTLRQMSDRYSFTTNYLWILHQRGDLHDFIKRQREIAEEKNEAEQIIKE